MAITRPPAYSVVGPYQHGIWMVVLPNGAAAIMDKANLPKPAPGIRYFWLGTTPSEAFGRQETAIAHLGLQVGNILTDAGLRPAFAPSEGGKGKIIGVTGDYNAPGAGGPKPYIPGITKPPKKVYTPPATYPNATYPGGPFGWLTSITDFLKFISWLFHPLNLLRAVEFLTGIALIFFGIHAIMKGTLRSGRTHRVSVGGAVRGVVRTLVPESRLVAREHAKARKAGERAGTRQGHRDVAYREARRNVLRGSSNPPIEKSVRASSNGTN